VLDAIAAARRSKAPEDDYDLTKARDEGTLGEAPLPELVDLREPWHEVPQQGHTASCVGWSLADSVLRWHLVKAGRLAPDAHLSARHIWMSAKETDARVDYPSTFLEEDGTSLKQGLEVIRKFGAVLDTELPWEGALAAGPPDAFNASAASRRIVAYFNLFDDDAKRRFSGWRRWLAEHGPVAVLIQMDAQIDDAQVAGAFDAGSVKGSHSAALFGYGPDHFLLRSSWGPEWGDGGYARMSLAYAEQAVIESYGVIV
jgi:hypothetical protein